MAVRRRNTFSRWIVVAGSLLTGVGIWAAVAKPPASAVSAPGTGTAGLQSNASFSTSDSFLTQPYQQGSSQSGIQAAPQPRLRTRAS